ncbi:glycosyltransferase [Rhizobium sp. LC145]|jgi:glycosyltransferase involved in cell wall biosynthesis|uniref:glycosyltransferase n=1 Tax=Rhizobium sp. LC145 TaxID=1120688 RepID=UPI000629DFFE|nr:glycosyltransferase [Rhizobium sp. LC145]KKX24893.1 hypothetical protein YH62_26840 [Rhizobium sp. LC145]TKT46729.1 glycosyltransferase [Rhizobiaceae bacterium LC148]
MTQTISVVLATFNGERYLTEQLTSILRQTRPPNEVVVSDDNSQDGTGRILDRFEREAPFPVIRLRNAVALGFRENFLAAASKATGDWIAYCDQDDIWRADKLEKCGSFFDEEGVTQIAHQAELIDEHGNRIGTFTQGIGKTCVRPSLFYDVWGTFWGFSMVFRREILTLIPAAQRFIDYIQPQHLIAHDRWAFFLSQSLGLTVEIAEPLVDYRQHSTNLFGSRSRRQTQGRAAIHSKNCAYIKATEGMLDCIRNLPGDIEERFPAFRRDKALSVLSAALRQVEARGKLYESNLHSRFAHLGYLLLAGGYKGAHDGRLRWRSIGRDLAYCCGG